VLYEITQWWIRHSLKPQIVFWGRSIVDKGNLTAIEMVNSSKKRCYPFYNDRAPRKSIWFLRGSLSYGWSLWLLLLVVWASSNSSNPIYFYAQKSMLLKNQHGLVHATYFSQDHFSRLTHLEKEVDWYLTDCYPVQSRQSLRSFYDEVGLTHSGEHLCVT
jgi:hypothetical protein